METQRSTDWVPGSTRAAKLKCDHCGRDYRRRRDRVRRDESNYCSSACRTDAHRTELVCEVCGEIYTRPSYWVPAEGQSRHCSHACGCRAQRTRVTLECPVCGDSFERIPSRVRSGENFCSIACSASAHRTGVVLECEECGRDFDFQASRAGQRRYCSWDCFSAQGKRRMEESAERPREESVGQPDGEPEL